MQRSLAPPISRCGWKYESLSKGSFTLGKMHRFNKGAHTQKWKHELKIFSTWLCSELTCIHAGVWHSLEKLPRKCQSLSISFSVQLSPEVVGDFFSSITFNLTEPFPLNVLYTARMSYTPIRWLCVFWLIGRQYWHKINGAKGGLPVVVFLKTTPTVWRDAWVQRKRLPGTNLHIGTHMLAI